MIINLMKTYDVYYLELMKYKNLLDRIKSLTDFSELQTMLNNLKIFISDKINSIKSLMDSVLNGCIMKIKEIVEELNLRMRSCTIEDFSVDLNTEYLDENDVISALLSNETINDWIMGVTVNRDYVNISFDGMCDPANAITVIDIKITDNADGTIESAIFEVEQGDVNFDGEITPNLISNYSLHQYDGIFSRSGFTIEDSDIKIDNIDATTSVDLIAVKDVLIAMQLEEEQSTVPTTEQEQIEDLLSLSRTDSIATSKDVPVGSTETSEIADSRLDDIGQLVKLSDYNVYYDQDGNETDYIGRSILQQLLNEQNIEVSIDDLFDYYNETHRLGLIPIVPTENKIKPTASVLNVSTSEKLKEYNDLKSLIIIDNNDDSDNPKKKDDLEFPIDKYNSVITPYRESSGDLMVDLLVDIDNYLSDETVSEEQYQQAKQIKEEILQMTKYNIERLNEFKDEFGEIVTEVSVRDSTTYIRPSVNPIASDNTVCMYGSFENKENVVAVLRLGDYIIEVQYWVYVDDDIGYKYERLDLIQLEIPYNPTIYSCDVIDGSLIFTITTSESEIPIIFREFNVDFGKKTTTSDKFKTVICSDVPIGDKLRHIGRLIAMNENIVDFYKDMYSDGLLITSSNKSYFNNVSDVFRNNLLLGVSLTIETKLPINKCNFNLETLSWFVFVEYDPDNTEVVICELSDGAIVSFDVSEYFRNWVCFSIDFNSNQISVNGKLFKTITDNKINYLFNGGQQVDCISFCEITNEELANNYINILENP